MQIEDTIVLKFGSSVLRTPADLPNAVHEIYRWYRCGYKVLAVVSAIGRTTDQFLAEGRLVAGLPPNETGSASRSPEPYALAELLATGERTSAALLALALDRAGIRSRVLNPSEIALTAVGDPLDSEPVSLGADRVRAILKSHPVLVVPGFFGTDLDGRTHLLGRGGSDLTAVFFAGALGAARCRLIKDVDGVYESDPAASAVPAAMPGRFQLLDNVTALEVARPLIQPKAVQYLRLRQGRAEIASCSRDYETTVGAQGTQLDRQIVAGREAPSRVLLLGLGTVGSGVYQRLAANPEHFKCVGALVRDRGKYERLGIPSGLLRTRLTQVEKLRADIVVDALSDPRVSGELARHFLARGVPFVSAGKGLIADLGPTLADLARRTKAALRYHAAVGGSAPMIEAVDRVASRGPIVALAGVLNGTCNFVLDRCGEGAALAEALTRAQRAGFAEVDASDDLSGADAARKVRILSRHAFGADPTGIKVEALTEEVAQRAREVRESGAGRVLRQVARASRCGGEIRATVRFEELPQDSPLGSLADEWNALQIQTQDAVYTVSGRGAGRWPTAEAVMADLFEIRRERCAAETVSLGQHVAESSSESRARQYQHSV